MTVAPNPRFSTRYGDVTHTKASGATYTPTALADFVADEMLRTWRAPRGRTIRLMDPAVGEGALLLSLLHRLPPELTVEVHGFDSDSVALEIARRALADAHPRALLHLRAGDFLTTVLHGPATPDGDLFALNPSTTYDLVIANPPYVRTQIMGAHNAQRLAAQFGLRGRVDLYYAFLLGIARTLRADGVAGVITSNRFMTTRSGASVRRAIQERFHLRHVWDLGDTKLFNAAVLPAVLIAQGLHDEPSCPTGFSSIYETKETNTASVPSVIAALAHSGVIAVPDGRRFHVQHGVLDVSNPTGDDAGVWRVATAQSDSWLATVTRHTWAPFARIGKVRVGVKTCADKVFIGRAWASLPDEERPELLRPLTTHHVARRFRADPCTPPYAIIYPHEVVAGKRQAVDLTAYPKSVRFLAQHRAALEARSYVAAAGRQWYELWVPQDPAAWAKPKLVFRDISEEPCFWLDLEGSVVNGDCYWLACDAGVPDDLLWLAASVGNSTFIEAFYDHRFNNKLYAGRRRFITQYVENFPLPDPQSTTARAIIALAKQVYACTDAAESAALQTEGNRLVWSAFGLPIEER